MTIQLSYREDDEASSPNLIEWDWAGGYIGAEQSVRDVRVLVICGVLLTFCFTFMVVLTMVGYTSGNPMPYLTGAMFAGCGALLFTVCILCLAADVIKHIQYAEEEYHGQVATIDRLNTRIEILKSQLKQLAGESVRSPAAIPASRLLTDGSVIMFPTTKKNKGSFQ
jgi:hypothetical protein